MACDKNYRNNVFFFFLYNSENKKEPTIQSVQNNIDYFEYYSGYNELYAEYSFLLARQRELFEEMFRVSRTVSYYIDYMKDLQNEITSCMERIHAIKKTLDYYDQIEDDILKGKTLIFYKGERR